jgi:hypothetical protein
MKLRVLQQDPLIMVVDDGKTDQAPSLLEKISNLTQAGSRVVQTVLSGQQALALPEEIERRLEICQGCDFFTGKTCKKCGCFIRFKSKLATEHCPINKW